MAFLNLRSSLLAASAVVGWGAHLCSAQQYGRNHVPVRRDDAVVEAAFPDPNVTLLAPAFTRPESIPAGFVNGTFGPTPDMELGRSIYNQTGNLC